MIVIHGQPEGARSRAARQMPVVAAAVPVPRASVGKDQGSSLGGFNLPT